MDAIANNVYIEERYLGVTLGVITQARGLIQIDAPPSPEDGRAWRASLMGMGNGPERVLINLMENASKFSPSGGRIEVGAGEEATEVHMWVKDNGPGIPPAEQEHIFNKFTRLHGNNRPGGLGIGLAFCRLAVLGHGGRIWVESEFGKGAAFHFTFPIATREQLVGENK